MTCLMAITDKVLRECGACSVHDSQAQVDQAKLLIWFLNRPGLPLSVVAGAVERCSLQVPMFLLSDNPEVREDPSQTVDAVIARSDAPQVLRSMLQSVSSAVPLPVVLRDSSITPYPEPDEDRAGILDDLRSVIDSFAPKARQYLIAEIRVVLAELAIG